MIKSYFGPITNPNTGESKDILVTPFYSKNVRDYLIAGGIIMIGFSYLALSAFKNGSRAFEQAEYDTLEALDLFTN